MSGILALAARRLWDNAPLFSGPGAVFIVYAHRHLGWRGSVAMLGIVLGGMALAAVGDSLLAAPASATPTRRILTRTVKAVLAFLWVILLYHLSLDPAADAPDWPWMLALAGIVVAVAAAVAGLQIAWALRHRASPAPPPPPGRRA